MFEYHRIVINAGLILFCLLLVCSSAEVNNEECTTPGGARGVCKNIKKCKALDGLLTNNKTRPRKSALNYLKKSICRLDGKDPIVCCRVAENSLKSALLKLEKNSSQGKKNVSENRKRPCGVLRIADKIFGGNVTSHYEFPWLVRIGYKIKSGTDYRCGGSLINSRYVLTAAHCFPRNLNPVSVRLGETNGAASTVHDILIEKIIPHPHYVEKKHMNDIALIKLARNVEFMKSIYPVCLPIGRNAKKGSLINRRAIVVGYGRTETGWGSEVPLKVALPVLSLNVCSEAYKKDANITERNICAGGEARKDSCVGDSGGPLHLLEEPSFGEHVYVQHGIVSFGPAACGTKGLPGVYTNVGYYLDWIQKNGRE